MIKIGTRSSQLALWQANTVAHQLEHLGHETQIIKIDSIGDQILDKPLYELGVTGVFTKSLWRFKVCVEFVYNLYWLKYFLVLGRPFKLI